MMHRKRFMGMSEVTGEPFLEPHYVLDGQPFPACVPVSDIKVCESGLPIARIREQLLLPSNWGRSVSSGRRWEKKDGETILRALSEAD
jgi:hypothetical protein